MERWEYRIEPALHTMPSTQVKVENDLNALGDQGWELVALDTAGTGYFKRPAPVPESEPRPRHFRSL